MPFLSKTGSQIGTVTEAVYTVPATLTSIVLELDVTNVAQTGISVNVQIYDADTTNTVSLAYGLPIPIGSSAKIIAGQKIVLNENDEIRVTSNVASSTDVVLSVLEDV